MNNLICEAREPKKVDIYRNIHYPKCMRRKWIA